MSPAATQPSSARRSVPESDAKAGPTRLQKISMAAVLVVAAVAMLAALLIPTQRPVGSNGVLTAKFLATVDDHSGPLCIKGVNFPDDADSVRLLFGTHGQSGVRMRMAAKNANGKLLGVSVPPAFNDAAQVKFELPTGQRTALTLCFSTAGARVDFPGEPNGNINAEQAPFLGKLPIGGDIAMEYLPAGKSSAISSAGAVLERASLFRPSWTGVWTYYLIFPAALLLIAAGWLLLLRAGRLTRAPSRRMFIAIAAIAFANAALWALITPAFNTPDELAHFTYVETLAGGHLPDRDLSKGDGGNSYRPSTVYASALTAVGIIGRSVAREPWSKDTEREFYAQYNKLRAGPDKPYGLTPSNAYSPAYYLPAVAFYEAGSFGNIFDRLYLIRLYSALLLALTVIFVMLFVGEILPRFKWAPPVAGLVVAFEPMAVHLGGGVSNDYLMIPAGAATLWLGARVMRRGPTFWGVFAASSAFAVALIAKPTSAGLAPALAFALLIAALRSERRLRALGTCMLGAAAPALLVLGSIALFGGANTTGLTDTEGLPAAHAISLGGYLSYLWQWYLPSIGPMQEFFFGTPPVFRVFFGGFLADFNSLDTHFPNAVYVVFGLAGIGLLGLCVRAVWQRRERLPAAWPIVAFPLIAVVFTAALINTSGYLLFAKDGQLFAQGRYFFAALGVFALYVAAAGVGAGKRWSMSVVSVSVMALAALNVAGIALSLARFYL